MSRIAKPNFVLKSEKDKSKPALIYIMFTLDKRYKISIGESIEPKWWNRKTSRAVVIETSEQSQSERRHAKRLNKFLNKLQSEAERIFNTYSNWRELDSPNMFMPPLKIYIVDAIKSVIDNYHKKDAEEQQKKSLSPSEFFKKFNSGLNEYVIKRTGALMKDSTKVNYRVVLNRYLCFLSETKFIDSFSIFDKEFEGRFTNWCYSKNYTANTIAASFSIFKIWLNKAYKEGLLQDDSFRHYRTKADTPTHFYLNEDEICRIRDLVFDETLKTNFKIDLKSQIEETRDLFVIACRTGLRYSDWGNLNTSEWDWEKENLTINTKKTGERVVIPIHNDVKALYQKYNGVFPKPADKSHTNKHIEKICMMAGIDDDVYVNEFENGQIVQKKYKKYEKITSHTARRSFATNLYLRCKNAGVVMKFTGHKTEENFFKYICVSKLEVADLAREYFQ